MADIQYLNYGDLQIELLALLNALADNVQNYVAKQSWSNKRKLKFMSAYSDIMNKGILGASNSTGQWMLDINDDIDFDSMDRKDKEMYGEAAYFIQQQMAGLPTKSSKEEEKNESELPKYDNFSKNFINYVSQNYYGGNPIRTQEDWNILDERNTETGLRGTDNRVKRLSDYLKNYSDSLEEGKYNFEGSPFKNLTDLKTKINTAITKLNDGTWNLDDTDALNAIGLRSSDWFNNGSGDPYKTEGYEGTYGDYYQNHLPKLEKAKQEAEVAKLKAAKQAAYNNTLFITRGSAKLQGKSPQQLKLKYGADDKLRQALFQYSQSDIRNLSPDEQSEIHGAYRYLAKSPIDTNLFNKLKQSSGGRYKNANPNRFKKIDGIDGLIWDSAAGQVILILNRELYNANQKGLDLFKGVLTPQEQQLNYLNSKIPGMTNAEWQELTSIGLDIASIIDPEPFTAAGLGIGAAYMRTNAKNNTPGFKRGFWDYVGEGLDYTTGAIAAIPGLGDAGLGIKLAANSGKWLPLITKALRLAARAGATTDVISSASPATKAVYDKVINGKELTVGDWREIATLIRGLTGHGMLNKGNRAARKVMEESGLTTTPSNVKENWVTKELAREGFFSSKVKGENQVPTLKIKKTSENGKVEEKQVELTTKQRKELGKVKPSELDAKARELGVNIPEGYKIDINTGWRAKALNLVPGMTKNRNSFGTKPKEISQKDDNFDTWLSNRGIWSKMYYGWNPRMRELRGRLNIYSPKIETNTSDNSLERPVLALPNKKPLVPNSPLKKENININPLDIRKPLESPKQNFGKVDLKEREILNNFLGYYRLGDFSNTHSMYTSRGTGFGSDAVKAGKFKNELLEINLSRNKAKELRSNPAKLSEFRHNNAKQIQQLIDSKKATSKEAVEMIKELKKKGFLKQGGTIDKQKIQRYKEFIKK